MAWSKPVSPDAHLGCQNHTSWIEAHEAHLNGAKSTPLKSIDEYFDDHHDIQGSNCHHTTSSTISTLLSATSTAMCRAIDPKSRSFLPRVQLVPLCQTLFKVRHEPMFATPAGNGCIGENLGGTSNVDTTSEEFLRGNLLRTLAVLVLLNKTESIPAFLSEGFTDSLLPIRDTQFQDELESPIKCPRSISLVKRCFKNWTVPEIESFIETQWAVLSPFFNKCARDVSLYDFDADTILPFIDVSIAESIGESTEVMQAPSSTHVGGHSVVRKVKIHPSHHNFDFDWGNRYFAVKELRSTHIQDFQREVVALRTFVVSPHAHIIKLLAAFRRGPSFYLLFPWATGDLREFWQENPRPAIDTRLSTWIAKQLLGIASALSHVHDQHSANLSRKGRHGDLKPENILWFKDHAGESMSRIRGTLKISDFGLSKVYLPGDPDEYERPRGYSRTYRAPEIEVKGNIGNAYDIWSLGCIFLETAVWMIRGWDGVNSFALGRATCIGPQNSPTDDAFFDIAMPGQGTTLLASLKPVVVKCINNLAEDHTASLYIIDLLSITRNELLQVNWETRAASSTVVERLRKVYQRCLDDPTYTVALPRPRKPPWSPSTNNNQHPMAHSQTLHTLAKMGTVAKGDAVAKMDTEAQSREPNYEGLMTALSQDQYFQELNENSQATNSGLNLSIMSFGENISIDAFPNEFQPLDMPFQQEPPNSQNITYQNNTTTTSVNRKRTFDNDEDHSDIDYHLEKKLRMGEGLQLQNPIQSKPTKSASRKSTSKSSESTTANLPCPFYHQNPARYNTKTWRACTMPTWDIPRLKEHIYRKHCSNCHKCSRCLREFDNISDLEQHLRADTPCLIQTSESDIITVDEVQKAQIKKKSRRVSDEEKWKDIYRIIFKLDPSVEVPSPHSIGPAMSKSNGADTLAKFETYLHQHISNKDSCWDKSTINACLGLIRDYNQDQLTTSSVSVSEPPSLTDDFQNDTTGTSYSEETTMSVTTRDLRASQAPNIMQADMLEERPYDDPEFTSRFFDVFLPNKPNSSHYILDPEDKGRMLPEG